jgi:DNA replication protein
MGSERLKRHHYFVLEESYVNEQQKRLQTWIERGNVTISQLFFQYYKELLISDSDAMLIMHLQAFHDEGELFPTPTNIAERMHLSADAISAAMQRLMQNGYIEIVQNISNGVLYEQINLMPLWLRLLDCATAEKQQVAEREVEFAEGELFRLFEQEFGRLLSPMEAETVAMWLDQDHHSPLLIRKALMEAVLAQKVTMRYIDRILFDWKKNNIKTVEDADRYAQNFRDHNLKQQLQQQQPELTKPVKRAPFYNWLDEEGD